MLSPGTVIPPNTLGNDSDFTKIAFAVQRESTTGPVTIEFRDAVLEGLVTRVPGLQISFAVGGDAVVSNWTSEVAAAVPYRVAVANFGTPVDHLTPTPQPSPGVTPAPSPSPTPPVVQRREPITMDPDIVFRGVADPIRVVPGGEDLIKIRAFIYLLERNATSDQLINFTSVYNDITVQARNVYGQWVAFTFRIGQNWGTRQVGGPNGPTTTMSIPLPQHIGAHVYLPASIIASVFGFEAQHNQLQGTWTFW
jgi:hypothetical protein